MASVVTESLFWGEPKVGQTFVWGGGGARGRHRNDIFPITFILHKHGVNGGRAWHPHHPPPPQYLRQNVHAVQCQVSSCDLLLHPVRCSYDESSDQSLMLDAFELFFVPVLNDWCKWNISFFLLHTHTHTHTHTHIYTHTHTHIHTYTHTHTNQRCPMLKPWACILIWSNKWHLSAPDSRVQIPPGRHSLCCCLFV